ncbi:BCC3 [Auxenochlorella protothecoides x Auxenochlorella symbiontica]
MTVPKPADSAPESTNPSKPSAMADNGAAKLAKTNSTRSLLSVSYRELSSTTSSRGVPRRTADVSAALEQRIQEWGGDRAIHSVLVANNGLAAVKFIRSIRSWAYKTFGNERTVKLIAMATPEDMRADAEHIRMADQFVEVPGGKNVNNYANVGLITSVAVRTGVDAVWPGWGHASEMPELPDALDATPTCIRFIGPPSGPMAALGDKVGSTILAQAAGVPTLAWSGSGVSIAYRDCPGGEIPAATYAAACVSGLDAALASCEAIGYPAMLKASWGGGGKGIRRVLNAEDVRAAFPQVQGEVPGSPVFAMRLAPQSRHLEVQLLADRHGAVASLFSRDCSVQRRHQKIVEEGPVTAAPAAVLEDMEARARALARAVGYVGAATVEYLYLVESGEYAFLELNPRLQVEHPVTEWIAGVNIPAAQLLIAAGVPLHRLPDLRALYGADPVGDSPIDFEGPGRRPPAGHVVAVRITAENAHDGFKPTAGAIDEVSFRSTPDVWGYFSVKAGSAVHEFADSQFGHLFARGDCREAAIRAMVVALKEVKIRGEIHTPVDYVADMIQSPDFLGNAHHTGWLDARIAAQVRAQRPPWHLVVAAGAVLRATQRVAARAAEFLAFLQKGQLPPDRVSLIHLTEEFVVDGVKYAVDVRRRGPQAYRLTLGGVGVDATARTLKDGGLLLQLDGQAHVLHAEEEALGTRITVGSQTCLLSNEHDPSQLMAVSTGKLVRHLVEDGQHVASDAPYAEVEVMKMMMTLLAPAAGLVAWEAPEGATLAPGLLLARLTLDDPGAVRRAVPCALPFPELGPPSPDYDGLVARCAAALEAAENVLAGYDADVPAVVSALLAALDDPALALVQWEAAYGVVAPRLPAPLAARLDALLAEGLAELAGASPRVGVAAEQMVVVPGVGAGVGEAGGDSADTPAATPSPQVLRRVTPATRCTARLAEAMQAALAGAEPEARAALAPLLAPLLEVASAHGAGPEAHARAVAARLLESYLAVEERFETGGAATAQEVIDGLRAQHADDHGAVLAIAVAHQSSAPRAELVGRLLTALVLPAPDAYRPLLRRLAALGGAGAAGVARRAQRLLERSLLGELRALAARALSGLDMFSEAALRDLGAADAGDADVGAWAGGAQVAQGRAASTPTPAGVARRPTLVEGLYAGLGNLSAAAASVDARMAMLVEAPAAVDDALASLLDHPDPVLQRRALSTYIKRIYFPSMLHEPELTGLGARGSLAAVWAHACAVPGAAAGPRAERHGAALVVPGLADLAEALAEAVHLRAQTGMAGLAEGVLHVALTGEPGAALALSPEAQAALGTIGTADYAPPCADEDAEPGVPDPSVVAASAAAALAALAPRLAAAGFLAVSFLARRGGLAPLRVVFYAAPGAPGGYALGPVLGAVEPPTAAALELARLAARRGAAHASSRNRQWHVWCVEERAGPRSAALHRAFLRGVVRSLGRPALLSAGYARNAPAVAAAALEEIEATLAGAAAELGRLGGQRPGGSRPDWAHVFLSVLSPLPLGGARDEAGVAHALVAGAAGVALRNAAALRAAAVAQWELRLRDASGGPAWRVVVSAPTGHEAGEECVDVYREEPGPGGEPVLRARAPGLRAPGALDGARVLEPHAPLEALQQRRLTARRHRTTYAYDFPAVFENALRMAWLERAAAGEAAGPGPDGRLVTAEELVPDAELNGYEGGSGRISLVQRPPSRNDVGVVAWLLTLRTPECPRGRQLVAVANDITFNSGSFGPREDAFFKAATEFALEERLPLVYLAANSGARVGLAEEVKRCLRVEWNVTGEPTRGFKYLYLDEADHADLLARAPPDAPPLASMPLDHPGGRRHVLRDVVGLEDGLGVECLSGSGAIAGAYARAFREGWTLTLVSGRSVGIGAYLARLGRRCVQRREQPIILTGYAALNKLLGREVYTSQQQLGGPRVMGANGVSHHVVEDDLAGVAALLRWLAYTPARLGDAPPALPGADPVARAVAYAPAEGERLEARAAIAGCEGGDGAGGAGGLDRDPSPAWRGGLFDRGSWTEAQAGWARTVVTGRARLGGLPVGVVAVEVGTVTLHVPADPGMPDSAERMIPQAGQVWYPDSALKTAQAIEEFGLEGLPLFILANWRGFSGGQRDLFEGVLQAGSQIVEALRTYRHPVTVYLGPGCELRGGAWVVVDSQINPAAIEMYADPTAQGAVLEPQGVVEIKFRNAELIAAMHRLDSKLAEIKKEGGTKAAGAVKAREAELLPVYKQVAEQFAQMHDGPVRMLAKGVIRGIVPWASSRAFFAARLRRRLAQESLVRQVAAADAELSPGEALARLRSWFLSSPLPAADALGEAASRGTVLARAVDDAEALWRDDARFLAWAEAEAGASRIAMELKALRTGVAMRSVEELCQTPEGTLGLVRGLDDAIKSNPALLLQLRSLLK